MVDRTEQTVWMLLSGLACLCLASILDTMLMPINKSLWRPSYCLLTTGRALIGLAAWYWLLDVNPHPALRAAAARWSRPFVIYGMNALFVFALSGFIAKLFGYIKFARPDGGLRSLGAVLYARLAALPIGPVNTSLLHALLFDAGRFAVAWLLWRKRIFIKV